MQKLEILVKICENLPYDYTIYGKNGQCQKPNNRCEYYRKEQGKHFCHKKTLTPCLGIQ